jgi:hypothetical protein
MPVDSVSSYDPKVELYSDTESLSFNVKTDDLLPQQINCFQNGQNLNMFLKGNTVSVDINPITQPGRHRVNCTAPSISETNRYYWFSQPFFMPTIEGKWLD